MNRRALPITTALVLAAGVAFLATAPRASRGAPAADAQFRVTCPLSLSAAAFMPDRVPDGWVGVMPQDTRLTGAGLLWGPPDESGYLKPDEAKTRGPKGRRVNVTRWSLVVPHSFETWVYCKYGPLQLSKRTPADAVECTASSADESTWLGEVVFMCK